MKVISYSRVSSDGQAKEGVSLDAQAARIQAWAESKGFEVAKHFVDAGISGKSMKNRPALLEALDLACKLKGVLVVYSLSRASRSVKDSITIVERLHKAGADLVSLSENIDTTTASGKLTFQLFISLAEHERNLISERTTTALTHIKASGKKTGGIPRFGYSLAKDGRTYLPNAKELASVETMKRMRNTGKSYWQIAAYLNSKGVPTKNGGQWRAGVVLRILRNQPVRLSV